MKIIDHLNRKNKSDKNQIVSQTEYKISHVTHSEAAANLNYSESILTWLPDGMSKWGMESISVEKLSANLNAYKNKHGEKISNSGILKGLYAGGFRGEHCTATAPYLCFDIDVKNSDKPDQNRHLLCPANNNRVFEELKKISVITWKSNSGNGIAGLFYVPQIKQYTNHTKDWHRIVGKHITTYVSNYLFKTTGVPRVVFDQKQSNFRQVRLVADQQGIERKPNPRPFVFKYTSAVVEKKTETGIIKFQFSDYRHPANSIFSQFNNDNRILDILLSLGFTAIGKISGGKTRVKYNASDSSTSGFVDVNDNKYVNFSSTFEVGSKNVFRPSDIVCKLQFDSDWRKFSEYLYNKGYQEKKIKPQQLKAASKSLKAELKSVDNETEANKVIFKHCFELKYADNETKRAFIANNCTLPQYKKYFFTHLNYVDYKIKYDKTLVINKYVSEVLPEVLDFADTHNKIILRADTGKGKTTAFIRYFNNHRPTARLLILAPLTIIVDQYQKTYGDTVVFLTGSSDGFEHERSFSSNIVFSTYEQGIKHLAGQCFDYVVIDEIHQLLTANCFKADVIADLTILIKNNKTIGLTGTPAQIFKKLDFKLLDVDIKQPKSRSIEVRYSNKKVYNIIMTHLMLHTSGKLLFRVNAIDTCKAIKDELLKKKIYKENEICILYSSQEIKKSNTYKNLAYQREFFDHYKVVFTTAMIDEGISIDQMGFTDVVFIETSYQPRPEPIKQFFARFRNEETHRKNYLYLRKKNLQIPSKFIPDLLFEQNLETLIYQSDQVEVKDVMTTYNNLFSNNRYYYSDATVNKFYLAYAVTQVMFRQFNVEQFLDYLKHNYNLTFTINENYEVEKMKAKDREYKKQLKNQIAKYWIENKVQILQVLLYHSQSVVIKKGVNKQQISIDDEIRVFAKENLRQFEALFIKEQKLRQLGLKNPLEVLIRSDDDNGVTLQSDNYFKKRITVLQVYKAIHDPVTQADRRTAEQFVEFGTRCLDAGTFTNKKMYQMLKKCGVINFKAFTDEDMLFEILKEFDITAKRNSRENNITCTPRVY